MTILIQGNFSHKLSWFTLASLFLLAALSEANCKPSCRMEYENVTEANCKPSCRMEYENVTAPSPLGIGSKGSSCMNEFLFDINCSCSCIPPTSFSAGKGYLEVGQLSQTQQVQADVSWVTRKQQQRATGCTHSGVVYLRDVDRLHTPVHHAFEYNHSVPKTNQESNYHRKSGRGYVPHDKEFPVHVILGLGFCCSFLLFGIYSSVKKHKLINLKANFFQKNGGLLFQQHIASHGSTKLFTAEELRMAAENLNQTHNFSLGDGNGAVYKGLLSDGVMVAIEKKLVEGQMERFINEIVTLTKINHQNLVKFLGCCLETEAPMLVYELTCNGTLSDYIHHTNGKSSLPWYTLLKIASESAAALAYLHSADSSKPRIIHGNVKSSNILLSDCFVAKVSGFETSCSVPINESQISKLFQRTLGYLDPEYLSTGQLTDKSDVYSFGVVLLELLTGEMPLSFNRPENERIITSHFILSMQQSGLFQIVAPQLVNEGNREQLKAVAELAKSCLKLSSAERPTMEEVSRELNRLSNTYSKVQVDSHDTESEGFFRPAPSVSSKRP